MAVYFSTQNSTFEAEFKSNLKISEGGARAPPCLSPCYGPAPAENYQVKFLLWESYYSLSQQAINAVGEISFWALSRGKMYLSSATGDSRLHHHMILRVRNDGTDAPINLVVAHDFEGEKENRKQLFGKCFAKDIPKNQ